MKRNTGVSKYLAWLLLLVFTQLVACGGDGGSPPTEPALQSISIAPNNSSIGKGLTQKFTVTGNYSDNTKRDITSSVNWESSDTKVAIVGNSGLVTAIDEGSSNIIASINGISIASDFSVFVFAMVDQSLLDRFDVILGYLNHPVIALNNEGKVILAYAKDLRESGQDKALVSTLYDGNSWPPSWQNQSIGIPNYWPGSNPTHQLVMNESGVGGMIYDVTLDNLNQDRSRFGVAYFNGTTWAYTQTLDGEIQQPFYGETRTSIVGIDSAGIMYVTYQKTLNDLPQDVLVVARFNATGLIDVTEFPETVGNLYLSINENKQVMVLNTESGSRVFDGTTWGQMKPLSLNLDPAAYLKLSNSGNAEFITLFNAINHYHYGGTSWDAGVRINGGFSAGNGAAAIDGAGNIMVAYQGTSVGSQYHTQANYFNGTSWSTPVNVDNTDAPESSPQLMVDGQGNFVAIYEDLASLYVNYFNGSWHTPTKFEGVYGGVTAMNQSGDIVIVGGGCDLIICELYSSLLVFYP